MKLFDLNDLKKMIFQRHEAASRVSECFQTLTVKMNKVGKQPVVESPAAGR